MSFTASQIETIVGRSPIAPGSCSVAACAVSDPETPRFV
jgi:hypothetical protein